MNTATAPAFVPDIELTKKAEAYLAAHGAPGRARSGPDAPPLGQEAPREPASPPAGPASNSDSQLFLTVNTRSRLEVATSIELLIGLLDDIDGDPDLEDGSDDEHSLSGAVAVGAAVVLDVDGKPEYDLEADDSDLEDDGTAEPSLASPECHPRCTLPGDVFMARGFTGVDRERGASQERWAKGSRSDGEQDPGEEPEDDPAENGIGDADGLADDREPDLGSLENHPCPRTWNGSCSSQAGWGRRRRAVRGHALRSRCGGVGGVLMVA
jgi:hypothetical protein